VKDKFSRRTQSTCARQSIAKALLTNGSWRHRRALYQAYKAALTIKLIEDSTLMATKYLLPQPIHSDNVMSYLQANLEKNLLVIKLKLVEFKVTDSVVGISNSLVLEDKVYWWCDRKIHISAEYIVGVDAKLRNSKIDSNQVNTQPYLRVNVINNEPVSEKTGVLPRSIGRTIINQNRSGTEVRSRSCSKVSEI